MTWRTPLEIYQKRVWTGSRPWRATPRRISRRKLEIYVF